MKRLVVHALDRSPATPGSGLLEQVLHELGRSGDHEVVAVIGQGGPASIGQLDDLSAAEALAREGCQFLVCGDSAFLNQRRLAAYMDIKRRGWKVASLQSAGASVAEGMRLRENVFIDHGARVLPGANVGANVWVMRGAELGAGSRVGSSCWIGPNCTVSEAAVLGKNCTLGEGVTLGPGVVLPDWSVVNRRMTITESPATTLFVDPRFRAPVYLFDKSPR